MHLGNASANAGAMRVIAGSMFALMMFGCSRVTPTPDGTKLDHWDYPTSAIASAIPVTGAVAKSWLVTFNEGTTVRVSAQIGTIESDGKKIRWPQSVDAVLVSNGGAQITVKHGNPIHVAGEGGTQPFTFQLVKSTLTSTHLNGVGLTLQGDKLVPAVGATGVKSIVSE